MKKKQSKKKREKNLTALPTKKVMRKLFPPQVMREMKKVVGTQETEEENGECSQPAV